MKKKPLYKSKTVAASVLGIIAVLVGAQPEILAAVQAIDPGHVEAAKYILGFLAIVFLRHGVESAKVKPDDDVARIQAMIRDNTLPTVIARAHWETDKDKKG